MKDYRLVLAGEVTEFAIFVKAVNEHEAVVEAQKQYAPQHFKVLRDRVVGGDEMDGNTAALNQYQREQDVLDDQDEALRLAQQELSNDLFDGYFEGNMACVDWIDETILDEDDTANNLLNKLRAQYSLMSPKDMRAEYSLIIIDVCDYLAAQQKTHEDIKSKRYECGL